MDEEDVSDQDVGVGDEDGATSDEGGSPAEDQTSVQEAQALAAIKRGVLDANLRRLRVRGPEYSGVGASEKELVGQDR